VGIVPNGRSSACPIGRAEEIASGVDPVGGFRQEKRNGSGVPRPAVLTSNPIAPTTERAVGRRESRVRRDEQESRRRGLRARARSALTEWEGFPKGRESDSTCWLGLEASWDGSSLFFGPAAVAAGQSCRSAAKTFMISVASVVKWSQRQRALGSPAARKMGGHRPYLVARERDWVLARIPENLT
jgi:hypothetical protein